MLSLLQLSLDRAFEVSAYCFMPDHAHALIEGISTHSDFRRLVTAWKQQTGYTHSLMQSERLWQPGYHDHVLRREEDRLTVIAYLVGNPVRAGLVRDLREYPFWGSSVWSREELWEAIQGRDVSRRGGGGRGRGG